MISDIRQKTILILAEIKNESSLGNHENVYGIGWEIDEKETINFHEDIRGFHVIKEEMLKD